MGFWYFVAMIDYTYTINPRNKKNIPKPAYNKFGNPDISNASYIKILFKKYGKNPQNIAMNK